MSAVTPVDIPALDSLLRTHGYLPDRGLTTAAFIAIRLGRPLLLEGEVGVGKTELAKTLASIFDRRLIRLQCYEGIDTSQALYEWDYARQMLQIRALSEHELTDEDSVDALFGEKFLIERPCWKRSAPAVSACSSSTRSTAPTTSSRRSSSRCCPTSR